MSREWDHFAREAALLRDLQECGGVALTKRRSPGFGGKPEVKRTWAYPTSPGSGGPPADHSYLGYDGRGR